MNNVLIVSLNSGGTMGHGRIITSLSNGLVESKRKITIVSETDYSPFFNIRKNVEIIVLPKREHVNYTLGGLYNYNYKNKILEICKRKSISCVIFSTFFDLDLVIEIKRAGIKVILLSYPVRDTFRKALISNGAYSLFDRIISLYDPSVNEKKLENETIANPLKMIMSVPKRKQTIDILLTCGGGGRPSSKIFISKSFGALRPIFKEKENLKVIFFKGNSKTKNENKDIKCVVWSKRFVEKIVSSKIIISEAGYFTMLDLINHNKSAILIPGERIIDNQELRALTLASLGIGKIFFPFESKQKLTKLIKESLDNYDEDVSVTFTEIKKKFSKYKDLFSVVIGELQ